MPTRPYSSRQASQENRQFSMPGRKHRSLFRCLAGLLLFFVVGLAHAQPVPVANDDFFGVPYGQLLEVEPLGVLENDTLDGETDFGGTVELLSDVSNGFLALSSARQRWRARSSWIQEGVGGSFVGDRRRWLPRSVSIGAKCSRFLSLAIV